MTSPAEDDGPDLASVVSDQALRFMTSAQEWVRRGMADEGHPDHVGTDCRWCPLCQFVAVLRGERPEVTERVAEAAAALVTAARAIAATVIGPAPTDEADPDESDTAAPDPSEPAPPPRVQHIDLGEPS